MMPLGKVELTGRGFEIIKFLDRYGVPCSLQMSSLADYEEPGTSAVWLGIEKASPKVLASKAKSVGVETSETTGWVPFPIPDEVLVNTQAHLSRDQVAGLVRHLQAWLSTGSFSCEDPTSQ